MSSKSPHLNTQYEPLSAIQNIFKKYRECLRGIKLANKIFCDKNSVHITIISLAFTLEVGGRSVSVEHAQR